jgi:hypothetical protein
MHTGITPRIANDLWLDLTSEESKCMLSTTRHGRRKPSATLFTHDNLWCLDLFLTTTTKLALNALTPC